jgi:hypothetical protein
VLSSTPSSQHSTALRSILRSQESSSSSSASVTLPLGSAELGLLKRVGSGPLGEGVNLAVSVPPWRGKIECNPLGGLAVFAPRGASSWPRALGLAVSGPLGEVGLRPLAVSALLDGSGFEPLSVIPQLWQVCFAPLTFVLLTEGPQSMTARPLCYSY